MKNNLILSVIILLLVTFSACTEITVTTKVNSDGTFTRVITVKGDSGDIYKQPLPYPVDDSWARSYRRDTTGEKKHILTYSKTYDDTDVLNKEIKHDTSWYRKIPRHIDIKKRFGFFYSYLTFKETITQTNPFAASYDKSFLTPREVELLSGEALPVSSADSVLLEGLEEKTTEHLITLVRKEVLAVLDSGINIINEPLLQEVELYKYKDSVDRKLDEVDMEGLSSFIDYYAEWTGLEEFHQLEELSPPLFGELDIKWEELLEIALMDSYGSVVEMPGIITATNSSKVVGNTVSWQVEAYPILFSDYEMHVESRIVNYWAFVISSIIVLLLVLFLVVKAFQK